MKPAKIGQLTPKSYRSRSIDRSDSGSAGLQMIPTAQQAWLCGRDGCVVDGGVYSDGDHGGKCDGPVIATKHNVNATPTNTASAKLVQVEEIQGTATLASSLGESELSKNDNDCDEEAFSTQCSNHCCEIIKDDEQLTVENCKIRNECETTRTVSSYSVDPFTVVARANKKVEDLARVHSTHSVIDQTPVCDSQSPFDVFIDFYTLPRDLNSDISERVEPRDIREDILTKEFYFVHRDSEESIDGEKHQREVVDCNQLKRHFTDMNNKENCQSVVYANFLNDRDSVSPINERDKLMCVSNGTRNEQILVVNPIDCQHNRLSHQYLNSSVTGQHYPDLLPDVGQSYPFIFTDTGLVDCPDFEHHSNMIFSAPSTKETSFIEKSNTCQPHELSSCHHYYNKSTVFPPNVRDPSEKYSSRRCDDNIFKKVLPTKIKHQNRRESDIDMVSTPQLSQLTCPLHRSSHLSSQQLQLRQHQQQSVHQQYEQQQLLSQFQPSYHYNWQEQITERQQRDRNSITSAISLIQEIRCGSHNIRLSPVSLLWTFLSVLVAGTCLLSFLTPHWTIHPDHVHSFGLFNLCVRDQRFSHPRPLCINFGHQHYYSGTRLSVASGSFNNITEEVEIDTSSVDIARIPSGAWQASCLLFGAGVCVQILGALVSLVVLTLNEPWHHRVALINGYMQTVGVLLLVSGVLLYPVGFNSPFFSYYCDSSRAFSTGHCAMGWSYVTAVMSTALSIFCPVMSSFAEAQQTTRKAVTIIGPAIA